MKSGGKPSKGKDVKEVVSSNQYPELFDKCRPYLEGTASQEGGSGELPVSLQALLIKSQLLSAKQKDLTRRELSLRPVSISDHEIFLIFSISTNKLLNI